MFLSILTRHCRIGIVLPLIILLLSLFNKASAQGSNINISINNFYYNCSNGQLTVVYRLHNIDPWYTYNLQMRYGTQTGSQSSGPFTSAESVEVRTWSGPYTPGQPFRIWAEGYWNNGSPYTYYDYYPNILVPAAPIVTNNGASTLCNGETTTLSASGSGGTITWSNGSTGSTITVSAPGTYTATEVNGCGTSANSNAIVINGGSSPAAPSINLSGGSLLCNGGTASLVIPGGGNANWYRNGVFIEANSGSLNVTQAGSYTATLNNACGVSPHGGPVVITTGNTPAAPSVTPAGSQLLCNGAATTLTASGNNITWSNGATGNSMNVTDAGTYYAIDANTCGNSPASNAVLITTGNCPIPAAGGTFFICPGANKTLDAGAGYESYLWSNGATTRTISVGPGNYSVTVTKEGCSATSSTVTVLYYSVNAPMINASGPLLFCNGSSVVLSASAGSSWLWSNGATTSSITVSTPGSYHVTITDANGCSATSAPVNVAVNGSASASVSGTTTVCRNGASPSVVFTGSGGSLPYTFSYRLNGGAVQTISTSGGNSIGVSVPTGTAGTFVYELASVREGSGTACEAAASGSATIIVRELPSAIIEGNATVCKNGTMPLIKFTGSGGTAPYRFSFRINGGGLRTVQGAGSFVYLQHPTNETGTFTYDLLSVKEMTGLGCETTVTGSITIVVRELPTATISGNATVCKNSASPQITFTGSTGNQPYTFRYRINNGAIQTVTSTSGNSATVNVPTNTAGTFTYSLVGVSENGSCENTLTGDVVVVVRELPTATVSGNATVCQNGVSPAVTFTGSGGIAPYTFSYRINNGALLIATTSSGSSVSVNVPTNSSGTFTYSLVSVKESGTGVCENAANESVSIIVNPQPTVAVIAAPNTHLCNGETGTISVFNWVAGNTYTWYRNGVLFTTTTSQTISVTQAGSYTVMVTTPESCNASGISNTITITTGTVPTPVITGKLKVCPEGKTLLGVLPTFESWRWMLMPEGRTLANGRSFSAEAGQYRLRVMREGCYDSLNVLVTSDDTEYPAGQLIISPQSIPYGGKATLIADVTGAVKYEWDLGDSHKAVTLTNQVSQHYFVRSGKGDSVKVKVRAISERNCIFEFTGSLFVGPAGENIIVDRSWIGNLKDWNVFPNPFHDNLKMSVLLERNETIRIDLFTADGMWVKSWQKSGRKGENLFQLEGVETLASNVVYIITAIYNGKKHADRIYKY